MRPQKNLCDGASNCQQNTDSKTILTISNRSFRGSTAKAFGQLFKIRASNYKIGPNRIAVTNTSEASGLSQRQRLSARGIYLRFRRQRILLDPRIPPPPGNPL